MLRVFTVSIYLHISKTNGCKMTVFKAVIIFNYLQFVYCSSVYYESGFKYLTEYVLSQIASSADISTTNTRWILQKVDHFDDKSKTWKMRYFENLKFFKHKGPVYIYLGGESEASPGYLSAGIIKSLAQETNGAMFLTEHRYYGKSLPFDDITTNVKHMKWLSSRQALADIAHLIKNIKTNPTFKLSKVVVIGGSYAGNLAAWMRLMYSDLVDAAIASSGPVIAKKDFFEYLEKVNENYELYGTEECLDKIKKVFAKCEEMLQSPEGIEELKNKFNICPECDMNVVENQWVFFSTLMSQFMSNSQYGNPQRIKEHCSKLDNSMRNTSNTMLWNSKSKCMNIEFDSMIKAIQRDLGAYSWTYQTCTEFGYYQTTTSDSQPFGKTVPLDFFIKMCRNVYGPDFDEDRVDKGVDTTNKMYGGLSPNVTRVVFVNGDMDPWSRLGILEDLSYEAPATVIHRASHCTDLLPDVPGATEEIKEAAEHAKYLIKHWIGVDDNSVVF
ncbi:putative serine protease K12H4.7 [Pieris rapae]|uniref:putative serine protease K12H4.7 n=1 Tax=Pieris rapae TaxID=64459 RepID=UPI001E28139A|nr:putative serine protease K12H4.7 [Pieris rapae]